MWKSALNRIKEGNHWTMNRVYVAFNNDFHLRLHGYILFNWCLTISCSTLMSTYNMVPLLYILFKTDVLLWLLGYTLSNTNTHLWICIAMPQVQYQCPPMAVVQVMWGREKGRCCTGRERPQSQQHPPPRGSPPPGKDPLYRMLIALSTWCFLMASKDVL